MRAMHGFVRRSALVALVAAVVALALPVPPVSAALVGPPDVEWAVLAGSSATMPTVFELDHDAGGNSYTLATMTSDLTLTGAAPIVVPMPLGSNTPQIVVASHHPTGDVRFATRISSSPGVSPIAMAVQPSGAFHVVVTAFDAVTFGTGAGAITVTIPSSGAYAMLAAFDATGAPVRAGIVSATGFMSAIDLTVSSTGEVSLLASYSAGVTLPTTLTPAPASGVVIIRFDSEGAVRWALPHSGGVAVMHDGHVVDDGAGNVVLAEAVEGTFTIGTGPGAVSFSSADADVVLARIDPDGIVAWTKIRGGAADDRFTRLAAAPSGGISLSWQEDPSFGNGDEFWMVAGYSAAGSNTWNQTITGSSSSSDLTVTADGTTVITRGSGSSRTFSFGSPPDQVVITGGVAMGAFDATGALVWAASPGARIKKIDAVGSNVGVAGTFQGPGTSTTIGEGSGAVTIDAADTGNLVLAELSTSTGIATNLEVTVDPTPLSLTSGASGSTRFSVINAGTTDAPAVHLVLNAGTGVAITGSAPSQGTVAGLDWSAGTIAAGGSAYVDVSLTADSTAGCLTPDVAATASFAGYDTVAADSTAAARVRVTGAMTLPVGADWVVAGGSAEDDTQTAGEADPRGGAVIAGSLRSTAVFGDDATASWVAVPEGQRGFYVASYTSAGVLRSLTGGHATNGPKVEDLGIDSTGAVTAVGSYRGDVTFDDSAPPLTLTGPTTSTSGFLAHWHPDGTLAWAIKIDGSAFMHVAVAPTGEIFVGTPGSVRRYASADGAPTWTRSFTANSYAVIDDVIVDGTLAPLVVGQHGGNLVVGAFSIPSGGAFMTRLAVDGAPQWVNPVADRGSTSNLAVAPGGDILRNRAGVNDGIVVERYSPGGALRWTRQVSDSGASGAPVAMVTSADGAIFVGAGFFTKTPSQPLVPFVGTGQGWFARLDTSGTIVSLVRTPGEVATLGVDLDGQLLVGGVVAPRTPPAVCAIGQDDAFVAKYAPRFDQPHLTGTITGPDDAPAAGVTVTVMHQWPSWAIKATTVTAADGTYDVEVTPGTYRVRFFDGQARFARRWWNVQPTYKVAGELIVDWNVDATASQQLDAIDGGAIRGAVTNETTGSPVMNARVQIFNANGYVGGATVNAFGHFNVWLPADSYWVRYVDPTRTLYSSWFGGVNDFPSATQVVVTTTPVVADGTLGPWPAP